MRPFRRILILSAYSQRLQLTMFEPDGRGLVSPWLLFNRASNLTWDASQAFVSTHTGTGLFLSALSSSAQTILRDFPTRLTSKQSCSFCKFVFANYLALLVLTLHQIWVRAVGGCSLSVFYKAREMEAGEQRRRGESKVKWHFAAALFTGRWWFTRGGKRSYIVLV